MRGMGKIWGNEGESGECMAVMNSAFDRVETRFANEVINTVIDALDVSYNERRIVHALLKNALGEMGNWLEQYLNSQVEIIGRSACQRFGLDIEPNYNYAPHAKLNDIFRAIEHKAPEIEKAATQREWDAEQHECAMMWLDDQNVPRADEYGAVYSLVGRMMEYGKMQRETQ